MSEVTRWGRVLSSFHFDLFRFDLDLFRFDSLFLYFLGYEKMSGFGSHPERYRSHFGSRYHIWSMRLARPFCIGPVSQPIWCRGCADPWPTCPGYRQCSLCSGSQMRIRHFGAGNNKLIHRGLPILPSKRKFRELREEGEEFRFEIEFEFQT